MIQILVTFPLNFVFEKRILPVLGFNKRFLGLKNKYIDYNLCSKVLTNKVFFSANWCPHWDAHSFFFDLMKKNCKAALFCTQNIQITLIRSFFIQFSAEKRPWPPQCHSTNTIFTGAAHR